MVSRAAHFAKKLRQFSPNAALVKNTFLTKCSFECEIYLINSQSSSKIDLDLFLSIKHYPQTNFAERFDEIGVVQNFLEWP